ncbi:hypothetical protein Sinac_7476 [Singulisphaera acidiphila DSM 18658]|uniref:Uncharacterized protein n=1 Tax=Singulisphaera acidiphila (strain ATCC BAA-1392 / DSM 18658 / VKM B-2454 / MOB10) TaxID=886293 RepID=L0DR76_SINAD|nr:hypothetical protein Sinac_7476 [Singulisphaera acidiphila DSM 18658]
MIAVERRVLLIIVTLLRELEENVDCAGCVGLLELLKRWFVSCPDLQGLAYGLSVIYTNICI